VQKSALLVAIQKEIHRHDLSYFVDEPPSVAQGGGFFVTREALVDAISECEQFIAWAVKEIEKLRPAPQVKKG
jgi:hypothetical protein